MESQPTNYKDFRRRLDETLRQRDPSALRSFMLGVGEWHEPVTVDPEKAMWLMIAASPALAPMHGEAERWLVAHGCETEARAIFGERGGSAPRAPRPRQKRPSSGSGASGRTSRRPTSKPSHPRE